jgi:hypothetical protein
LSELSQLSLDEGSVLDAAAHLGDAELQRLVYTLEQIIEVVSPKRFSLTEAKGLPSSIANLKKSYADDLAGLMDDLAQQGLSPKEFEKAVRPLVSDNFEKAFKLGSKRDLMPGDEEWLRRAVDSEVGYARDLADGVAKGATITPDLRANSYAAALDGVGWNGAVESMPEGTVIHWVLGQAEHCDSCCLIAAHSPYDKYSLPTTPRAGDTDCRMNCKCRLVFKQGEDAGEPQDGVFGIDAYLGADEMPVPMQGEGLLDWLAPGEAPEGMMLPNATERLAMDEMYNEVNYNRRLMSQLDPDSEEFMAAVQARKEANGELIDYMEERGIWDKPLLSVDEVITGKDISMLTERQLFEMGLSGDALEEAGEEVTKLVGKYRADLGKKFTKGK